MRRTDPKADIVLVSASPLIKTVTNFKKVARVLETFEVEETAACHLTERCANVRVLFTTAVRLDNESHVLELSNGDKLVYDKICLCTGASPNLITDTNPQVVGIRDTQSVQDFQRKLLGARRIMVVGNGGIATELVHEVSGCEVIWVIKDASISSTFFDEGAAVFFLPHLLTRDSVEMNEEEKLIKSVPLKRQKYMLDPLTAPPTLLPCVGTSMLVCGSALGPDWSSDLAVQGCMKEQVYKHVHVEYKCSVARIISSEASLTDKQPSLSSSTSFPTATASASSLSFTTASSSSTHATKVSSSSPLYVELTNGKMLVCDLLVSATGVNPNTALLHQLIVDGKICLAEDGGVPVDNQMRTKLTDVYAAGDVCTIEWTECSPLWFQMRLWSQARQMGSYSAQAMVAHSVGESLTKDFCFELFSHVTKFFGYKVVLLGRYKLDKDCEVLLRCTKGMEYVKVLLKDGCMIGAILVGETGLEETFEQLILNQMDLSNFGESLLDPDIDITDYFD